MKYLFLVMLLLPFGCKEDATPLTAKSSETVEGDTSSSTNPTGQDGSKVKPGNSQTSNSAGNTNSVQNLEQPTVTAQAGVSGQTTNSLVPPKYTFYKLEFEVINDIPIYYLDGVACTLKKGFKFSAHDIEFSTPGKIEIKLKSLKDICPDYVSNLKALNKLSAAFVDPYFAAVVPEDFNKDFIVTSDISIFSCLDDQQDGFMVRGNKDACSPDLQVQRLTNKALNYHVIMPNLLLSTSSCKYGGMLEWTTPTATNEGQITSITHFDVELENKTITFKSTIKDKPYLKQFTFNPKQCFWIK